MPPSKQAAPPFRQAVPVPRRSVRPCAPGGPASYGDHRRQATRALLVGTGDDRDRDHGHRVTVLAREQYCAPWARERLLAAPETRPWNRRAAQDGLTET